MTASIFTIVPSFQQNEVIIQDVLIMNCISLKNPIINILFSSQTINLNKVIIKNMKIKYSEDGWIKLFGKTGMFSQSEIFDITGTSNALISLKNCKVILQNILIQGIFGCPLIKLINVSQLLISQLWAIEIQTLYAFNLLEVYLEQSINQLIYFEFLYFQYISDYNANKNFIFSTSKINYVILGCKQVKNEIQEDTTYSFNTIIKLFQQSQQTSSLIQFQSNSNKTVFHINNLIISKNNCSYCLNGLMFLDFQNFQQLKIRNLFCYSNYIKQYGCIIIITANQINQNIQILNSDFLYNNCSSGVAIYSANMSMKIHQCKILYNIANYQGGGLFLDMNTKKLQIKQSTIMNNIAQEGGGIYIFKYGNINQDNLIKSFLNFNKEINFADNLVETPTHLILMINSQEIESEELYINNISIRRLKLRPHYIFEQGKMIMSQYLTVPSDQVIKDYRIYILQSQKHIRIFNELSISLKNSKNELLHNLQQFVCQVSQNTAKLNQFYTQNESKMITNLQVDTKNNYFDLGSVQFHYNPYQEDNLNLQILISSYKCQLGEFYVDEGCQICQSIYGFYSVTYNATKCSIFDKNKFANISSNAIQLLEGYWRSDYYSDQTDFCFKNIKYCKGGWKVGHELCSIGHLGGLCEECDKQNIRGEGKYFKNQENTQCYNCSTSNVASFIFASLWAMISILITLKSIEKSNELFSSLRFRIRYRKILFKFYQDLEGIFIKMLLNYLWIFSVIFTFNIKFQISFSFVEQTSNTSQFMAFSLDCFLSDISEIELIYVRIIATILLILIQFTIILFGYQIYIVATKGRFQANIISNTLLYLYVSNYSGLIKQFCSIISRRIISNTHYIQGDVTLKFGSLDHYSYILQFAIPGLTFFGCLIPFSLFLIMHLKKDQFNQISLRRHICYLFNEYNEQTYFWKQIKFSKKTIIILVMTYFESNILLKASLLGLCLLVYQLLAVKHQPYIISNLNSLDLQTGQICSIAIFLATVKYVSEQETQEESSKILQLVIMFLCVRLCYPFILNIFRVYVKKYRVEFITLLQTISKYLKIDSQLVNYLSKILIQWRQKENRLKSNYQMLKKYLMAKSKAQIKYLKSNNSVACAQNPLSLNRDKQLQTATANFIITFQK